MLNEVDSQCIYNIWYKYLENNYIMRFNLGRSGCFLWPFLVARNRGIMIGQGGGKMVSSVLFGNKIEI